MQELFPATDPYRTHRLSVSHGHRLYVEECGRADGLPVVFLHGGPGAACESYHRQFFNPDIYRVILFDHRQREVGACERLLHFLVRQQRNG